MYSVTFEAIDLNLLPDIPHAQALFNGELSLSGRPGGAWTIEGIRVDAVNYGVRPITEERFEIAKDHPLWPMIEKAARAHDQRTAEITNEVREQLSFSIDAAAFAERAGRMQ